MKINFIFLALLSLTLTSCGTPSNSSDVTSESVSEIVSESIESEAQDEPFFVLADDFPPSDAGGYPSEGEYLISERRFYLKSVMQNNGKYNPTLTVQMKKLESYFYNLTAIHSLRLEITLMKNESEYTGPMHYAPTLCVSDSLEFNDQIITGEVVSENDTTITYEYNGSENYRYMKIINESNFAQYIYKLEWKK